ncbi:MAG: hypothetical protein EWM45_06455 [Rhodopseudomonas palustris]|nr:MAG: hypothetical protein EWM45_06455 [Rhodopseudomonas palustris]
MAGLVPAIHALHGIAAAKTWMPGTRPGMTNDNQTGSQAIVFIASVAKQSSTKRRAWIASSASPPRNDGRMVRIFS